MGSVTGGCFCGAFRCAHTEFVGGALPLHDVSPCTRRGASDLGRLHGRGRRTAGWRNAAALVRLQPGSAARVLWPLWQHLVFPLAPWARRTAHRPRAVRVGRGSRPSGACVLRHAGDLAQHRRRRSGEDGRSKGLTGAFERVVSLPTPAISGQADRTRSPGAALRASQIRKPPRDSPARDPDRRPVRLRLH